MNRFAKSAFAAVAGFAAVATPLAGANAGEWRHGWYDDEPVVIRHHRPRHRNNDALVGGLIGLTAGLIIMDAVKNQPRPQPVYRPAPQVYDYPPAPYHPSQVEYGGGIEPWSRDWYRYCSDRYRSFNPETGTYRGYDGRNHFCVAN